MPLESEQHVPIPQVQQVAKDVEVLQGMARQVMQPASDSQALAVQGNALEPQIVTHERYAPVSVVAPAQIAQSATAAPRMMTMAAPAMTATPTLAATARMPSWQCQTGSCAATASPVQIVNRISPAPHAITQKISRSFKFVIGDQTPDGKMTQES